MKNLRTINAEERMPLRAYGSIEFVIPGEVLFCHSRGRNSVLVKLFSGRELLLPKSSLKELEGNLPGDIFYRCHVKYLINLNHMHRYVPKSGELELSDGTVVMVAKARRAEFRTRARRLRNPG